MEIVTVALVLTVLIGIVQVVAWILRKRYSVAALGTVFLFAYPVDLIDISFTQKIYLVPSLGLTPAKSSAVEVAGVLVVLTWWLFVLLATVFRPQRKLAVESLAVRSAKSRPFVYFVLVVGLAAVVLARILSAGVSETLELRQSVFGDDPLVLVGYFALPALAAFGFVVLRKTSGAIRGLVMLATILASGTTLLLGSRTALFLGLAIPVALLAMHRLSRKRTSVSRDMLRVALVVAFALIPVVGGSWYLEQARGFQATTSTDLFQSVDISQSDALVGLIQADSAGAGAGSYLSGIGSFIPRSIWVAKPLPGNVQSSLILAADRYNLTGAQITSGILGEAFLNVGVWAPLPAALLLALFALACDLLIRRRSEAAWMLGVLLLLRGINLVRGDVSNVAAPSLIYLMVWVVIFFPRRKSTELAVDPNVRTHPAAA